MATTSPVRLEVFEAFAKPLVESGRYKDLDEVLAAAQDALMREEASDEAKRAWLIKAIEDGEASGIAEGDVVARVLARAGLPAR